MMYRLNTSVVSAANNHDDSPSRHITSLALLTVLLLMIAEAKGQTREEFEFSRFMEQGSQEGYAAAKATGDARMMNMFSEHHEEQRQDMERTFAEASRVTANLPSRGGSFSARRELTAVDETMLQLARAEKLLIGPAKNSDSPDNPDINLRMPDEFWSTVRKKKNEQGDISDFYKKVIQKYFASKTAKEKCHWFFYAVKVSDNAKALEQRLKSGNGNSFAQSLAQLYEQAEQPDLNAYFTPAQSKSVKKYLASSN